MRSLATQLITAGFAASDEACAEGEGSTITTPAFQAKTNQAMRQLPGLCARLGRPRPKYTLVYHDKILGMYTYLVYSGTRKLGSGTGPSKGEAQEFAAQMAVSTLESNKRAQDKKPRVQKAKHRTGKGKRSYDRHKRKSDRGSKQGRAFEVVVTEYMQEMVTAGEIDSFEYHEPNSDNDQAGKDFTAYKNDSMRAFGVTTSQTQAQKSRMKHPGVPIFFWPHNTKPETIKKRILELFDTSS